MPVREMLARTSSLEITEWMAYERLTGPLDLRQRGDISASIVAATVANSQGGRRKLKPADFMPKWFKRKKSVEEIWHDVMAANTALGGTVRQRD